jgi:hypothetical protein
MSAAAPVRVPDLARIERHTRFQELLNDAKRGKDDAAIAITKLYNLMSTAITNTKSRVQGSTHVNIGAKKVYLHHLALISSGRVNELAWINQLSDKYEVSHLCHQNGCFNPDHPGGRGVVEELGAERL